MTAMALAAIGTDFEAIVEDYSRSQEGLDPVRSQMVATMEKDGLDASFADAPPEVNHVCTKHTVYTREGDVPDTLGTGTYP